MRRWPRHGARPAWARRRRAGRTGVSGRGCDGVRAAILVGVRRAGRHRRAGVLAFRDAVAVGIDQHRGPHRAAVGPTGGRAPSGSCRGCRRRRRRRSRTAATPAVRGEEHRDGGPVGRLRAERRGADAAARAPGADLRRWSWFPANRTSPRRCGTRRRSDRPRRPSRRRRRRPRRRCRRGRLATVGIDARRAAIVHAGSAGTTETGGAAAAARAAVAAGAAGAAAQRRVTRDERAVVDVDAEGAAAGRPPPPGLPPAPPAPPEPPLPPGAL